MHSLNSYQDELDPSSGEHKRTLVAGKEELNYHITTRKQ